jgi:hypothetical protein
MVSCGFDRSVQWPNKHLLSSWVDDKRKVSKMSSYLQALVDHVIEHRKAGLEACYYVEEFHLWRICPLDWKERPAYECLWLGDPTRNPLASKAPLLTQSSCLYRCYYFDHLSFSNNFVRSGGCCCRGSDVQHAFDCLEGGVSHNLIAPTSLLHW